MKSFVVLVLVLVLGTVAGCGGGSSGGGGSGTGTGTGTGTTLPAPASDLYVGVATRVISPTRYETWNDLDGSGDFDPARDGYDDLGSDHLADWQEPGAFGADGAAGRAGADDDHDGFVDEIDEYRATGSDDLRDPTGDNFHASTNPYGTQGNGRFNMVPLAGFGGFITGLDFRPMKGIIDDIESRTIAISKDGLDLILQSNDLVGMLHVDMNPVKRRIERELGIPFANIVIASTHTHASPDPVGIWAGTEFDESWLADVRERMFESARAAFLARRPAVLKSVTVEPETGMDRLTLVPKRAPAVREADQLDIHDDPARGFDVWLLQNDLRDPIVRNTAISAMRFDDPAGSGTIATVVNWHDHPEVMGEANHHISADFAGHLRRRVESRSGGLCVYFSGTLGGQIGALRGTLVPRRDGSGRRVHQPGVFDANGAPVPEFVSDTGFDKAWSLGLEVADEAVAALDAQAPTAAPGLDVRTDDHYVDFENPAFQALTFTLTNLRRSDPQDRPISASWAVSSVGVVRSQISWLRVGDVEIVTFPGEAPPEYLLGRHASVGRWTGWPDWPFPAMPALRPHLGARDVMAFSLANNYLGYLVPASDTLNLWDVNHPNHYEEIVSSGPNFGDGCGTRLMQMVGSPQRFSGYPARP